MTDKREAIEAAASSAIKHDGLKSVSFRTLADEVGVKSSSVHYHFPTKGDLAQAVVRTYADRFAAQLETIAGEEATLAAKLNRLIDVFSQVLTEQNLCLCGMMSAELASLDPATRGELERFFRLSEGWLKTAFTEHQEEITIALSPTELARLFMSGLEGASLVDRVHESTDRLNAYRALARAL